MNLYAFPEKLRRPGAQVVHIVTLSAFYIVFMLVYRPYGAATFFETPDFRYSFHVLMTMCILIGVLMIMRLILFLLRKFLNMGIYVSWCFFEALVCSMFVTLYTCLFHHTVDHFFESLPWGLEICSLTLVFPYVILFLCYRINDIVNRAFRENDHEDKLRIYDERGKLRLVLLPSSIYYLASEENYVKIVYNDAGDVRDYVIRSSMKSLETSATKAGLVRCHRSYLVNPANVRALRKNKDHGLSAELEANGRPLAVPVGKTYYQNLLDRL